MHSRSPQTVHWSIFTSHWTHQRKAFVALDLLILMDQTVDTDVQTLSSTKLFKAHEVNEPCKKWKNMWKRTKRKAGSGPFRVPFVKLLWIWNHEIGRTRRSRVASLAARHRVRHPTGHGRHCRCHEPHCYPWPTAAPGSVFIMFYYSSPILIWYHWYPWYL